jgi:uncharacterized membrane protein
MMSDKYSFIVVKYPQQDTAQAALDKLKQLRKEKVVELKDAVAITKTEKGKVKLHQTDDDTGWGGFWKGGLIGVILSLLFGGPVWALAGAAVGTLIGWHDRGIKNDLLNYLGGKLTPNESALAVLINKADWAKLEEGMEAAGFHGEAVITDLTDEHMEMIEQLAGDPEVVEAVSEEIEVAE